jgi:predicted ABC-type ATPase
MGLVHSTPRLRMFAGPNGSGKSTIKSKIAKRMIRYFLNPDEIEAEINRSGYLDFQKFSLNPQEAEVLNFFLNSTFLSTANLNSEAKKLTFQANKLHFSGITVNSYFASVAADFIRHKFIQSKESFSFETVMSSPDKIDFLRKSRQAGYRNYLYYVATDDPSINIERVAHRVKSGGHNVPTDKIEARYYRSLDLLADAIKLTNRAYIFDNSLSGARLIAEITDAKKMDIKIAPAPFWFQKYVVEKFAK